MESTLGYDALQALIHFCISAAVAIIVYLAQFPERLMPGKFDLVGHSHQLFHVITFVGASLQLNAILRMYEFSKQTACNVTDVKNMTIGKF